MFSSDNWFLLKTYLRWGLRKHREMTVTFPEPSPLPLKSRLEILPLILLF